MKTLRAIIVDDERYARKEMLTLLAKHEEIEVIGESATIKDTVEKIKNLKPDLIFLDIQLAGETGFELFEKINADFKTVFVTAFDNYAIRAFEVNAFDYLLKPVHPDRLAKTIERLTSEEDVNTVSIEGKLKYDDRIYVSLKESSKFLQLKNITCICADNEYSRIVTTEGKNILIYKSLKKWEDKLPDNHFVRIHRSTIVNINHIRDIQKLANSTFRVYLNRIEEPFEMSRRFAAKTKERFNQLLLPDR